MKVILRSCIAVVYLFLTMADVAASGPASPQPGLWWNPAESGRGFTLDPQGDIMVVATYAYDNNGLAQWYISSGPLSAGGYHWSGTLEKFNHGQPLNGAYTGPGASAGNDGVLTLDFTSKVTGFATLPGGRRIPIQRTNFGVGDPPNALLGQWALVYLIGTASFADMYLLTTVIPATSTGNGVVTNAQRNVGFEYQVSGAFVGQIFGVHFSSTGTILDQYIFQLMLEEGRGNWVSPTTFNQYGMNVYKMYTASGMSKAGNDAATMTDLMMKTSERPGISIEKLAEEDPVRGELARQMWNALKEQ